MKQTFTKDSIKIMHGDIYMFKGNHTIASNAHDAAKMGFIQLDRKAFVKPVDTQKLAEESYNTSKLNLAIDYILGYKIGYKANPNEFTREDMIQAVKYGAAYTDAHGLGALDLQEEAEYFIDSFRLLSVPASVTIENNQVIEVIW